MKAQTERIPNGEQQRVINDFENNILLYASAGTGKTFTVAQKVKKILEEGRALPEEILLLTFTIKACDEMKRDLVRFHAGAQGVYVKTIHGFCYELIKEEMRRSEESYAEPTVCDETDQEEILSRLIPQCVAKYELEARLADMGIADSVDLHTDIPPREFLLGKLGGYREFVSKLKHYRAVYNIRTANEVADFQATYERWKVQRAQEYASALSYRRARQEELDCAFCAAADRWAGRLVQEYNRVLKYANRLDFDDLIIEARTLLSEPAVLARWKERFKFIVIDEMQDTSELEYDVLKQLFANNRVMMCGDFFQTIYEWRGSNPRAVLEDFCQNFRAKTYMLSENYRSTRLLTAASFGYLKNSYPEDIGKFCPAEISYASGADGEPIRAVAFASEREEAAFLFRYLKKHTPAQPSDVCIISRSNRYIGKLWGYFNDININLPASERLHFFTVDKDYRFFKKPVVKDMLAFWALAVNPSDELSLERLAWYIRGIGNTALANIRNAATVGVSLASFMEEDAHLSGDPYRTLLGALKENCTVVYDIETTGLDLSNDEIVQIAAMKIDRFGNPLARFEALVLPTAKISAGAAQTHGITREYIENNGGMSANDALKRFSAFVEGAVLVGHNSTNFDRAMIDRQLSEEGLAPLSVKGEYDTLTLARLLFPNFKNHKLETLCEAFGIVNERAHDALSDVAATAKVAARIADILEATKDRRIALIERYQKKFEPFYRHFTKVRSLKNDLRAMNRYILEKFPIRQRYKKATDSACLQDLTFLAKEQLEKHGNFASAVRELLTHAALAGSQTDLLIRKLNKIPIITVHQSKGCEFDTVLLAGTDDGNFPSFAAMRSGHGEEEARVFYVALSRAKRVLVITYCENEKVRPSPFLEKIPHEYVARYCGDGATIRPT
ncbi:MAG: UvrD-helicase domain-containing protein [Clostridia bacterium]|nr:UvrD-helicase domain-containing protein [Clostridia bacterium]